MKRIFILALDGTPYSFLLRMIKSGRMPNLAKLAEKAPLRQMDSVIPSVSSVAWASFMTGKQPHEHGIMGFIDRNPVTMDWYVPLADRLKSKTIFEILSATEKRVFVMNVPLTYPPKPINGISIPGFLCSDITKGTFPVELGTVLKARDYKIDANTELAKTNLSLFYDELNKVFDKRVETMWHFWQQESWDFFMMHIMETDRLHHFFWEYMENDHPDFKPKFYRFYEKIDSVIGQIVNQIPENMSLMILSDHGFTTMKSEFYLNQWLREKGYLCSDKSIPETLKDLSSETKAYSLYPGRIFINLKGREKYGKVEPGIEYENLRQELIHRLLQISDPQNENQIIEKVILGEDIYSGTPKTNLILKSGNESDIMNRSIPDLIAIAKPGYDLKGNLWRKHLFEKTVFNGMHTFDDAFVLLRHGELPDRRLQISDLAAQILTLFKIDKFELN
jgi:predicted AlkP superfamily phosphohydrolase/phosphomutase